MTIDERFRALSRLPAAEFRRLVEGYARIASDVSMASDDRLRARRRLRLLQLSRIQSRVSRVGEVGIN